MEDFIRALQSSEVQLPPLLDYATGLYFVEFSNIRQDNEVRLIFFMM